MGRSQLCSVYFWLLVCVVWKQSLILTWRLDGCIDVSDVLRICMPFWENGELLQKMCPIAIPGKNCNVAVGKDFPWLSLKKIKNLIKSNWHFSFSASANRESFVYIISESKCVETSEMLVFVWEEDASVRSQWESLQLACVLLRSTAGHSRSSGSKQLYL